jgi:muconolactone delta-isomerase
MRIKEIEMKYLVMGNLKDTVSTMPPAKSQQLLETCANWVYRYKSANLIVEIQMMVGSNRFVAICNSESNQELMKILSTMPIGAFGNLEVFPLADMTESINALIQNIKILK